MVFSKELRDAVVDYSRLIEKGYPEKRTRELVADRYALDRAGRSILLDALDTVQHVTNVEGLVFHSDCAFRTMSACNSR